MARSLAFSALILMGCAEPSLVETINTQVNDDHPYSRFIRKISGAQMLRPG